MQKVQLLMPVHALDTPWKVYLFHKCLKYLDYFDLDRHAFIDDTVNPADIELLTHHHFTIHAGSPIMEWDKVQYGYDLLQGPYIAICHQDDFWIQGKLDAQLKYIYNSPIVVTGYLLNEDHFQNEDYRLCHSILHHDADFGLVDCMPSTWLLNKTILPQLPVPFIKRYCSDLAVLLAISRTGPIEVIQRPYILYNCHPNNQSNTIPTAEVDDGRQALRSYNKTINRPVLHYRWE